MPLPRSLSRRACNNGDQLALATPCCAAPASVLLRYIIMESSGQRIHNFGADPGAPGRLSRTHSRSGSGDRHRQPNEVSSPPFTMAILAIREVERLRLQCLSGCRRL